MAEQDQPSGLNDLNPFHIESGVVRRRFNTVASSYPSFSVLQREVARRMLERLEFVKLSPKRILDVGCGTGTDLNLLSQRYPQAQCIGLDLSASMLRMGQVKRSWFAHFFSAITNQFLSHLHPYPAAYVCADARHIPLQPASVGLLWSNFLLHWMDNPLPALLEMHRVLEVEGLVMFATLGPDTLKEFREAFSKADDALHVHRFLDMHDVGDMLVASGFSDPVMDMEKITLTYESVDAFLKELRGAGSVNALVGRRRGLMGRDKWKKMRVALQGMMELNKRGEAQPTEEHLPHLPRLPITFEIIYGHAWKPKPKFTQDGHQVIRFDLPGK